MMVVVVLFVVGLMSPCVLGGADVVVLVDGADCVVGSAAINVARQVACGDFKAFC